MAQNVNLVPLRHIYIEHSLIILFFTELIKLRSAHGTYIEICECSSPSSNKVVGRQNIHKCRVQIKCHVMGVKLRVLDVVILKF
jgi:hypothetical protein